MWKKVHKGMWEHAGSDCQSLTVLSSFAGTLHAHMWHHDSRQGVLALGCLHPLPGPGPFPLCCCLLMPCLAAAGGNRRHSSGLWPCLDQF